MNFLTDVLVAILTAYLAFTSNLANFISNYLPTEDSVEEAPLITDGMVLLPSLFRQSIPDILLKSSEYQQATVGAAAGLTADTPRNPIEAIVNIFCTFKTPEYIRTTTGTGFFIDPDGIIMTNAHIAQFLLMEETDTFGEADCLIRTGSPAAIRYQAELLYLPPAWIQANANNINEDVPMGTGERDYALLYVTSDTSGSPLPAVFPALRFDSNLLPTSIKNDSVVAAGYPATALIKNGPNTALLAQAATTTISELYTFGSNYADVFSLRGSVVGAEGSSGGPIVNENGDVIGMIATRGDDVNDGAGSLRAITLSYIDRTIKEETGFTLAQNLNGDLPYRAEVFNRTISPFLISLLQANQQ